MYMILCDLNFDIQSHVKITKNNNNNKPNGMSFVILSTDEF